jgi:hypothetical protein
LFSKRWNTLNSLTHATDIVLATCSILEVMLPCQMWHKRLFLKLTSNKVLTLILRDSTCSAYNPGAISEHSVPFLVTLPCSIGWTSHSMQRFPFGWHSLQTALRALGRLKQRKEEVRQTQAQVPLLSFIMCLLNLTLCFCFHL